MSSGFMQRFQGKIKAAQIFLNSSATMGLFLNAGRSGFIKSPNIWTNAGAPTSGGSGTFNGFANKGDLLSDTTNGALYQNTNTLASPTWTLIEAAGGQLPVGATGTFGGGAATFGLSGDVNVQSSAAGAGNTNDTTEDTLFTYSLPANSLNANNRVVGLYAFGAFANNAHSKHARLYFGSEVIDTGANTTTGAIGWALEALIIRTGSKTQQISGQIVTGTTHGGCTTQAGAEDDTTGITIKVTGQTGTAAANDIVCNGLVVNAAN
jgi:hypothetical protein